MISSLKWIWYVNITNFCTDIRVWYGIVTNNKYSYNQIEHEHVLDTELSISWAEYMYMNLFFAFSPSTDIKSHDFS